VSSGRFRKLLGARSPAWNTHIIGTRSTRLRKIAVSHAWQFYASEPSKPLPWAKAETPFHCDSSIVANGTNGWIMESASYC
jgi:hypothetical protein